MASFLHPDTLADLGHFLLEAIKRIAAQSSKLADDLPMITVAYNASRNSFLVVGTANGGGPTSKNTFSQAFKQVATKLNVEYLSSRLESDVVELAYDDLQEFLKHLEISK